jgi:hypothetical protein
MTINYTWNILNIEVTPSYKGFSDIVCNVDFEYTGTNEDGISHTIERRIPFYTVDSNNYIPYNQLTKEKIVNWIETSINLENIHKLMEYEISIKARPNPQAKPLPW